MKAVPGNAVVVWLLVAVFAGVGLGLMVGTTLLAREVAVPGPETTETKTETETVSSPSPFPVTVTYRACMAAQGESLDGWAFRPYERQMLRALSDGVASGLDPAFAYQQIDDLQQGAIDRYEAAADRCFNA